jgi:hypothetical protein
LGRNIRERSSAEKQRNSWVHKVGRMLPNCIIPKAGMQQEDIVVNGERKQGRPWLEMG